ncbi:MAG TPA: tRNA (adenosine(37)-N6)-dimethylallyltransferase MiaA [Dokdonella sp.]|uniref:tRNA (adenosine(37)-N6)-dimethylallyltransferase MiaA n=2 Tax=Dokdonella sp. TaxID=2291710 RepID=UPI002BF01087|nr:tRNA (adenosine(37)-N6)-dimethylallyltransferase MiaA [Dokdonella sp.]HPG95344.1 tRNA (adenosine(37)-N6)-dimethylallyltransferase MiaA [Dokdonella sp.]HPN79971.1 tRNA (adenosine(37)-N6)-dimethylallyltransferase MiaA [Dokdonella sp.]
MHSEDSRPRIIFLMGATASGKTRLACELADEHPFDLVSVDSALVYRGMDIGTAKPDAATLARYPHRLVDIRDPEQAYSAAEFRADAIAELQGIAKSGRIALLVGGTGLYFRALERGLSELPEADSETRTRLAIEVERFGKAYMHERLARLDPQSAARLNVNDSQRVQRALEVFELRGKPMSDLQGGKRDRLPFRILKLALVPRDRSALHARIAERFDLMLEQGFVDELRSLRRRPGWSPDLPSMRAVGYRQGWAYLDGSATLDAFRLASIHATRQLAKRQMTWLRSEVDARMFDSGAENVSCEVGNAVRAFLDR